MDFHGKNVVATNESSRNHGRAATLRVAHGQSRVQLRHWMNGGSNEYGIELDRSETLPDLVVELIGYCPRRAVPDLLGALGRIMVAES
jgi:hypothetical protein